MFVLRGAVTFFCFTIEHPGKAPRDLRGILQRGLKGRAFEPIDRRTDEERAVGFVELEAHDRWEFSPGAFLYGSYALLGFRVDQLKVPAAALKAEHEKWRRTFEEKNSRPPSKAEKTESRDALRQQFRSRAIPISKVHDVSWNLETSQLQIWASSRKLIDEVQLAVEQAFEVKLLPLSPAALAVTLGIPDKALAPTAELCGVEEEVAHG